MNKELPRDLWCAKISYRNETKARRVAAQISAKMGRFLKSYECPKCGFWHLAQDRRMKSEVQH